MGRHVNDVLPLGVELLARYSNAAYRGLKYPACSAVKTACKSAPSRGTLSSEMEPPAFDKTTGL